MTDGRTLRPHEALGSAWPFNWRLAEARPGHGFALLCLFHLVVWTAAPALMYHSLPRDTVEPFRGPA